MKMNKKGQGFTWGNILAAIIAVILLVLLVLAITGVFGNWDDIKSNFFGSKVNIQTIVDSCKIACAASQTYDYCTKVRDVYIDKKQAKAELKTCKQIESLAGSGLGECPNIDCIGTTATTPSAPVK